ncbi:MAG: hypothetical protein FJW39_17610 [Acidobacteria bacterium]|nr:hypothetical protein [Acidobacteriota bacterium]
MTPAGGNLLFAASSFRLGQAMKPGTYVLELEITGQARNKPERVSQWIDFQVLPAAAPASAP